MEILDVENNFVKFTCTPSDDLALSGFVIIKDEDQNPFIGQITNLEGVEDKNIASAKLIFNFTSDGVVTSYNGSIPSFEAEIVKVGAEDLLELFPLETPLELGDLAQQGVKYNIDISFFNNRPLVLVESLDMEHRFVMNLKNQLANADKKTVIFDFTGDFNYGGKKLIASENYKLPLDYDTINFIYDKGLDNATPETKALIQEIFLEVQNYVKTLPEKFIPFNTFKNVVDDQYYQMQLVQMVLLKNKLLKYADEGIFATQREEFDILKEILEDENIIVINLSKLDEDIQREYIAYTYRVMEGLGIEVYSLLKLENENSDKKLLKQIYSTKTVKSCILSGYDNKFINQLKQISKDLFMFAPLHPQNDFASYNTFLEKLNEGEFIIWGKSTHSIPFIVATRRAAEVKDDELFLPKEKTQPEPLQPALNVVEQNTTTAPEQNPITPEANEQINRDVDEVLPNPVYVQPPYKVETEPENAYTEPTGELAIPQTPLDVEIEPQPISDEYLVTEDDLDLLDELEEDDDENIQAPQAAFEVPETENAPVQTVPNSDIAEDLPSRFDFTKPQQPQAIDENIEEPIQDNDMDDLFPETGEEAQEVIDAQEISDFDLEGEEGSFDSGFSQTEDDNLEEDLETQDEFEETEIETPENKFEDIPEFEEENDDDNFSVEEVEDDEFEGLEDGEDADNQTEENASFDNFMQNSEEFTEESQENFAINNEETEEETPISTEEAPEIGVLPADFSSTPIVPIYGAEIEETSNSDQLTQGDVVQHTKYGRGVVEKLINYGTKTICSIQFDNVGRRLLDPTLSEIKKVEE